MRKLVDGLLSQVSSMRISEPFVAVCPAKPATPAAPAKDDDDDVDLFGSDSEVLISLILFQCILKMLHHIYSTAIFSVKIISWKYLYTAYLYPYNCVTILLLTLS